jgi:hypothetical protein
MEEIYVSTDVEVSGPIPGPYSMLSFGSAAYLADKTLVDTFAANLDPLPGAQIHPRAAAFWQSHPEAWEESRRDPQSPEVAMPRYVAWVETLPGRPVFVAYPATFDFLFVYWYMIRFAGRSPFGHSGLDIRTYAMAVLGVPWHHSTKRRMPERWFDKLPHTHRALDDAIEQGALFCNILAERGQSLKDV